MAQGLSADIFVSYVEEDSAVALEIVEGLEADGYSTWCYELNSVPGVSYLLQTSRAIEQARAVVVLISPHSLGSHQVTKEVVRAHETEKPFIPVLISISHVEFGNRQPEWREAIGSATTISVPQGGVGLILPRILSGLRALGIEPRAEGGEPTARPGVAASAPVPVPPAESRKKRLVAAAAVAVVVAVVATAAVALGGGGGKTETSTPARSSGNRRTDNTTATTDFGATTTPQEEIVDAATSPVQTSQGPARVSVAHLTSEVCPTGGVPEPCRTAPGGALFLVVELVPWNEGSVLPYDQIYNEAFSSYVVHAGQKVTTNENWLLEDSTGRQVPTGIRVVYAVLPASAAGSDVVLYWPSSTPVRLHPTG